VPRDEQHHVAMPKLYGAPAYARPPVTPTTRSERPFDVDELPLEAALTEEERKSLRAGAAPLERVAAEPDPGERERAPMLLGRPLRLRAITHRFRGNGQHAEADRAAGIDRGPASSVGE
jgi:hypothetical protein